MRIKHEELYLQFTELTHEPTELGRVQFHELESRGIRVEIPDPYFIRLDDGRRWFDLQQSQYRELYYSGEWWGWYTIWLDWEGKRWVLPHLFRWCDFMPSWVSKEKIENSFGFFVHE